jgi:hypothetical protein
MARRDGAGMACWVPHTDHRAVAARPARELGASQVVAEPTRRLVLAAAAAGSLTLVGCTGIKVLGPVPKPGADVVALEHAIAAEELMVARYTSALRPLTGSGDSGKGSPSAVKRAMAVVSAIHAEHEAHLAQLRTRLVLPPRVATARPHPSPTPPPLPAGWRDILAALATAESAASDRLIGWVPGVPPALAQLMASIAASEAAHVVLLDHPKGAR